LYNIFVFVSFMQNKRCPTSIWKKQTGRRSHVGRTLRYRLNYALYEQSLQQKRLEYHHIQARPDEEVGTTQEAEQDRYQTAQ